MGRGVELPPMRMKAARRTRADKARRGRGQEHREQVSSDGKGGEYRARGYSQEASNDESVEWSGADSEESEGSATEEERNNAGGGGGGNVDADRDGVGNTGKRPGASTWGSVGRWG